MSLLQIRGLSLSIGETPILRGIDLSVGAGEVLGLVGESGSGKSMTALTIMRLLPESAHATGKVTLDGTDTLAASEAEMCSLRGDDVGMVFQEPMTALNPLKTIGEQVAEGIRFHRRNGRAEAEDAARKILDRVGLPEAQFPLSRYPHQLSGGQRQRVVIAIACALKPKLLIADEPTTALDVVLQKQILELLRDLVVENRMGLLLISHDLAVVADMADRIAVMRQGEVLDTGETGRVLTDQAHPYTRQLAQASAHVPARRVRSVFERPSAPSPSRALPSSPLPLKRGEEGSQAGRLSSPPSGGEVSSPQGETERGSSALSPDFPSAHTPLLSVEHVSRDYPGQRVSLFRKPAPARAVHDVSFSIQPGQSVALVGRSGCGKSTLARMILALDPPTSGDIRLLGKNLARRSQAELRSARQNMQVVFQDPYGSFDPRHRIERVVSEPLHLLDRQPNPAERRDAVAAALAEVGLAPDDMRKFPHEFSGGQRQRISIARAIITRPKLVVADEPVSALDVSIRAQILDLFADLNRRLGIAYLFITHDLTVARAVTDDVLVMHHGQIVERGPTRQILDHPQSEAAQALVAAAPDLERALARRMAGRQ